MSSPISTATGSTGSPPYESSALVAVDVATPTDEIYDDSFTEHELMEFKLRRKVRSKQAKLDAAEKELDIEKQQYYRAADNYNAALEQPNITEEQLDILWKQCEMKRKHVQVFKIFLQMCQEKADKADAAMSSFQNETIEVKMRRAQASTPSPSIPTFSHKMKLPPLSFSLNPSVPLGQPTCLPSHPYCTCATSIMDCDVCFSHKGIRIAPQKPSSPIAEQVSPRADPGQPTGPPRVVLNKYGDVPNPARQIKAARRRRNQELRRVDPARYAQEIAEKKIIRDAKLRAEREERRRR